MDLEYELDEECRVQSGGRAWGESKKQTKNTMHSPSLSSRTSCTTNTMGILRQLTRHIIVDDGLDSLDIETTRREVGSEEIIDFASFKVAQSVQTLGMISKRITFPTSPPQPFHAASFRVYCSFTRLTCSWVKLPCNSAAFNPNNPNMTLI